MKRTIAEILIFFISASGFVMLSVTIGILGTFVSKCGEEYTED